MIRLLYAILAVLAFAHPAVAGEGTEIDAFTLKNGMQVVLIPNHRVPAISHMLWYRVGAADDFPGRSGLAHYNEHMMFQGTKKAGSGEFGRLVTRNGGNFNAFTTDDYTAYYVNIAKEHLPMVMELEADRMLNLAPTPQDFSKEREVIIEERRMSIENQPEALLSEEMQAMLFRNHPYHNPLIGWMHEMQSLSREDVLDFHRQFYHPANAVLVVSGDITRKELQPLAEKYYGSLPPGDKYVRRWRVEPPQRGPRHISLHHKNVKQPELVRFYVAPSANTSDKNLLIPGFVLEQIVGGSPTGKLYQSLVVAQKIATGISVDYEGISIGPGMFRIQAFPAAGISLPQLEAALDKELEAITRAKDSGEDIDRAKTLLKADTLYARDSLGNIARTVGVLVMAGLPADYFNQWTALVDRVTTDEIKDAAATIFQPQNSVTGYLLSEEGNK